MRIWKAIRVPSKMQLPGPKNKGNRNGRTRQIPTSKPEILRREMMAAGERLNLALTLEGDIARLLLKQQDDELLAYWRECRQSVELFAEDYAATIGRYRRAVEEAVQLDPRLSAENAKRRRREEVTRPARIGAHHQPDEA